MSLAEKEGLPKTAYGLFDPSGFAPNALGAKRLAFGRTRGFSSLFLHPNQKRLHKGGAFI